MKGLCTVATGEVVQLNIEGPKTPKVGSYYILEPLADKGTNRQNRLFHPLIDCFFDWMLERNQFVYVDNGVVYDLSVADSDELKILFKIRYGLGADRWEYVDNKLGMVRVFDIKNIPDYVIEDFNNGNKARIKASRAKSWTKYKKPDRTMLIDRLINIMRVIGVDSNKFDEILEGIDYGS